MRAKAFGTNVAAPPALSASHCFLASRKVEAEANRFAFSRLNIEPSQALGDISGLAGLAPLLSSLGSALALLLAAL